MGIKKIGYYELISLFIVIAIISFASNTVFTIMKPFFIAYIFIHIFLLITSENLPGSSKYNIWGIVELHIGNDAKGNKFEFYRVCAATILAAKKKNRNVLITTWLISKEKVLELFKESVTFYNPTLFDKIFSKLNMMVYNRNRKVKIYPLIKFIINTEKLTTGQINRLEAFERNDNKKCIINASEDL